MHGGGLNVNISLLVAATVLLVSCTMYCARGGSGLFTDESVKMKISIESGTVDVLSTDAEKTHVFTPNVSHVTKDDWQPGDWQSGDWSGDAINNATNGSVVVPALPAGYGNISDDTELELLELLELWDSLNSSSMVNELAEDDDVNDAHVEDGQIGGSTNDPVYDGWTSKAATHTPLDEKYKRWNSIRPCMLNLTGFPSAWGLPQAHMGFLQEHGGELRSLTQDDEVALGRLLNTAGQRGAVNDPQLSIADSEKENLTEWSTEKSNMTALNFSSIWSTNGTYLSDLTAARVRNERSRNLHDLAEALEMEIAVVLMESQMFVQ